MAHLGRTGMSLLAVGRVEAWHSSIEFDNNFKHCQCILQAGHARADKGVTGLCKSRDAYVTSCVPGTDLLRKHCCLTHATLLLSPV